MSAFGGKADIKATRETVRDSTSETGTGLPHKAVPVSKLESGAHLPVSELAEAERKPG